MYYATGRFLQGPDATRGSQLVTTNPLQEIPVSDQANYQMVLTATKLPLASNATQ